MSQSRSPHSQNGWPWHGYRSSLKSLVEIPRRSPSRVKVPDLCPSPLLWPLIQTGPTLPSVEPLWLVADFVQRVEVRHSDTLQHSTFSSPVVSTDHPKHQAYYDYIIKQTGCFRQSSTLDCLKTPFDKYMSAVNQLPSLFSDRGLSLTFGISVDDHLLNKTLKAVFRDGEFSDVPFMVGSTDDEGTWVSRSQRCSPRD